MLNRKFVSFLKVAASCNLRAMNNKPQNSKSAVFSDEIDVHVVLTRVLLSSNILT